ncbi:hypothetical protein CCMA1212_005269 [Trichoderma ghanense]|uniref:DJ-1/PfpI domain-containing protein n=1 Tax=Trichoderma ghanense TaxID=65468 RepID=A0ABY2H5B0_9HYPO
MLPNPPTKYGVALFSGFQALDVFGPLDALNILSASTPLNLSILSTTLSPVSTIPIKDPVPGFIGQRIVPTHTYQDAPKDIEVLLVPGGEGTRDAELTQPVWVRHARWVHDGNIWTSSGVSAGIDMIYAFIADQYGQEVAESVATTSEYSRNPDSMNDPFSGLA